MDPVQFHHIPGLGVPVPSKHSAHIGWKSDRDPTEESKCVVCFLDDVGMLGLHFRSSDKRMLR